MQDDVPIMHVLGTAAQLSSCESMGLVFVFEVPIGNSYLELCLLLLGVR